MSRDGVHSATVRPFLKWAGGKWALATELERLFPHDVRSRRYFEPFLGGGAMFFYLRPQTAILSDRLRDLVTTYEVVRDRLEPLLAELVELESAHSPEHFYAVRDQFNTRGRAAAIPRAAWLIYLNRTCYNGLFRTNKSGAFNVPVGRYSRARVANAPGLRAASAALEGVELHHRAFEHVLDDARPGDFVYLDPPYVPLSATSSFAAYADGGFGAADQARLAEVVRALDQRGCLFALSNSDTELVRELYQGFRLDVIEAPRPINARGAGRGLVRELLVRNLKRWPAEARPKSRPRPPVSRRP